MLLVILSIDVILLCYMQVTLQWYKTRAKEDSNFVGSWDISSRYVTALEV